MKKILISIFVLLFRIIAKLVLCFISFATICGSAFAIPLSPFDIIDIGKSDLLGADYAQINNSGQMLGIALGTQMDRVTIFWDNGTITNLPTLGGTRTYGSGINDFGQIVGISEIATGTIDTNGPFHSFIWDKVNGIQDITPNVSGTYANGINNLGQVVGTWNYQQKVFIWDANNGFTNIFGAPGLQQSPCINNLGNVAVRTDRAVFLWNSITGLKQITELGDATADDINDLTQIVGRSLENGSNAFVWDNVNGIRYLVPLHLTSYANSINNNAQIVGYFMDQTGTTDPGIVPYLWENGFTYDLNSLIPNDLGWRLLIPFDINDFGQIIGIGSLNGEHHTFLLTHNPLIPMPDPINFVYPPPPPIPEPSTFLLLGVGLAGVGLLWRRFKS